MEGVVLFLIPIALFAALAAVAITKTISDNRARRHLVEAGASEALIQTLFARRNDPGHWTALKWGLLAASLGLGCMLLQVLPFGFEDPITYGVLLFSGGAGLLLYYAIAQYGSPRRRRVREPQAGGAAA